MNDKLKKIKQLIDPEGYASDEKADQTNSHLSDISQALKEKKNNPDIVNTISEFLDTLKGEKGEPGEVGPEPTEDKLVELIKPLVPEPIPGKDGVDGKDGINGTDGTNGKDGIDGINGLSGQDGKQGKDGVDGDDGKEASPLDVIEALKKLPEKDKLDISHLKNSAQLISALGKKGSGYKLDDMRWHGGGLSTVSVDGVTITGDGTPANPLVSAGGGSGGQVNTVVAGTGIGISGVTVAIDTSVTVDKTTSQTLTNKTLTSPAINTPTGIVKGDVGLGNVDNTSNATERAATATLTNKRITQRVVTTTDDSTAVIDVDITDLYELSAVANATTFTLSGTPTDGQKLIVRFKDASVAKGLTWTGFTAIGITLPTTTVASKWGYVGCVYNSAATQWQAIAYSVEA